MLPVGKSLFAMRLSVSWLLLKGGWLLANIFSKGIILHSAKRSHVFLAVGRYIYIIRCGNENTHNKRVCDKLTQKSNTLQMNMQ